ncbi:rab-GTPase-TBC domain-containing protein, partial [Radiomyces spectabilis]|uniref:rab-GTPase-TBC domain-containing protein n=1 Tax=Radiomyces spectabilis TaxID=64574 RepID=UPI00221F94D7
LHNLFIPGFPALMESFYIQERLIQRYLPKLFRHLNDIGLCSEMYSTRWYITLFTGGVVHYHTLLRIWDIYALCGYDILHFVAVVLLMTFQGKIGDSVKQKVIISDSFWIVFY